MKQLEAINNNVGGFDLMVERDAGNLIRILTGKESNSLLFWEELKNLAASVIDTIEAKETNIIENIIPFKPEIDADRKLRKNTSQGILKP